MSNYNIVGKNISVPSSSGIKNYYNLVLVNENNSQILAALNTTSQAAAKNFIFDIKEEYPNVTFNNKKDSDPFSDGTFNRERNYDISIVNSEDVRKNADYNPKDVLNAGSLGSPRPFSAPNYDNYESHDAFSDYDSSLPPMPLGGGESSLLPSMFDLSIFEKPARDLSGASEEKKKQFEELTEEQRGEKKISGVFGDKRVQAMAKRETTPSELVVARGVDNNAFITVGNDRSNKPHTGYGGKGHTQCDAVDIVAGLGGYSPKEVEKVNTENGDKIESEIKTNPNFMLDSARIYISQKTDVDKNFGLGEFGLAEEDNEDDSGDKGIGKYGAKSAVVAKADNIRLIGRESIRIVTGTDKFNSQGGEVLGKSGIEIVAMNDTKTLQPMVLGANLIELLDKILGQVENLAEINNAARKYQMKMNQAVQQHVHLSPFFAIPTTQSPQAAAGGIMCDIEYLTKSELSDLKQATNLQGLRHNYLTESGKKFINSKLNKVN